MGWVTTFQDDAANTSTWAYDAKDRPTTMTYPDDTAIAYVYDAADRVTELTDAAGNVIEDAYDDLGRRTAREVTRAAGFVDTTEESFGYDALNRMTFAEDDDYCVEFTYGVRGLASTVYEEKQKYTGGNAYPKTVTTTYDAVGKRATEAYPSSLALVYAYNDVDRLSSVTDGTNSIAAFTYTGTRPKATTFGNGTTETRSYTGFRGEVASIHQQTSGSATLVRMDYGYDAVHDRTYERFGASGSAGDAFEYDKARRLTKAWMGSSTPSAPSGNAYVETIVYNMDDDGNRTSVVTTPYGQSAATVNYATNDLNQYTTVGGVSQTHDGNGNLSNDGTKKFTYNYKNLICECRQASDNTLIATYTYDALGRRIGKAVSGGATERFIYSGVEIVCVYDGSNTWKQNFVFDVTGIDRILMLEQADVLDQDGDSNTVEVTRSYYHRNALGSVMEISTSSQVEAVSYRYTPYGTLSMSRGGVARDSDPLGQHITFVGRSVDEETWSYCLRSRQLDAARGRFRQRDPAGPEVTNLYEYVRSAPLMRADPMGARSIGPDGNTIPGTDPKTGPDPKIPQDEGTSYDTERVRGKCWVANGDAQLLYNITYPTMGKKRRIVFIQYIMAHVDWGDPPGEAGLGPKLDEVTPGDGAYPYQSPTGWGQSMQDSPGIGLSREQIQSDPTEALKSVAEAFDVPGIAQADWVLIGWCAWIYAVDLDTHKVVDEWYAWYNLSINTSVSPVDVSLVGDLEHGSGAGTGAMTPPPPLSPHKPAGGGRFVQ